MTQELIANGTTTPMVRTAREWSWVYASTTANTIGSSASTTDSSMKRFSIKDIAAQYTRIVFYLPTPTSALGLAPVATSTNAGISAQPILKKPIN